MSRTPKPVSEARANLEQSIPNIQGRYEAGVSRGDWESGAGSDQAELNYADGVNEAVSAKTRQRRVREVGNQTWQESSLAKGAPVIAQRMRGSLDKYERNFGQVYQAVLPTIQRLPARTRNVANNVQNRVLPVAEAFRNNRIKRS